MNGEFVLRLRISTAVHLHSILYGSKEELEKTATFILQTAWSLGVAAMKKKKKKKEEDEEEEEEEEECLLSYVGPPQNNKCIYTGEQVSK